MRPSSRRIQKSGPLGTTNYLYDGRDLLEEIDSLGNVLARYTQGPGVDQPLSQLRSGTTSYYQQDVLGSVTSLSDGTGALAKTYSYDSFGKQTASTGTTTNPFQYTGREFDQETGIYFYRARYLDQDTGRFLSEDPIGFMGGKNFYSYVHNRPTFAIDPSGLVTVIPLPDDHIHRQADIDGADACGHPTAGGCNKVDYRPDFDCQKDCDGWKAHFTIRLVGDIYVATGPFPYRGRQPEDRHVRNTESALRHEQSHTDDKVNAIKPIFEHVEGQTFGSKEECENAAANAEVQAGPLWNQAAADSQRRRH
jgi:RHS repeat-associated protein